MLPPKVYRKFHVSSPIQTTLTRFLSQYRALSVASSPARSPDASTRSPIDALWNAPSIAISGPASSPSRQPQPQSRPRATLSLSPQSPSPKNHDRSTAFFLSPRTPPPLFAYAAASWRSHAGNRHVPELCVLGCSNSGKSTLLNGIMGTSGLAISSGRPGSTRTMNGYVTGPVVSRRILDDEEPPAQAVGEKQKQPKKKAKKKAQRPQIDANRSLVLVDTPGYGFNSVKDWGSQIETYLERRAMLRGVVLLLRADVPLTRFDADVLAWLARFGKRTLVVLTRADRCDGADWERACLARYEQLARLLSSPEMLRLGGGGHGGGGDGANDWLVPEVCVTAAGMREAGYCKGKKVSPRRLEAGLVGARVAMLRLAGLIRGDDGGDETQSLSDEVVSWDDIPV